MPPSKKPTPSLFPSDATPAKRRGRPPKNGAVTDPKGSAPSAAPAPLTTAQQLGSIVKSARDIMRKDKGLNGDLDRLPMLTWIMFLKFLDDLERMEEERAALGGKKYQPFIAAPYRWRDWAAPDDGITGDALIAFVNQDEATLPGTTKRGKGLFTYLRSLRSPSDQPDRRDTIARVFEGTVNRMIDGYLLRDVINKINAIHFNATEEIHTLSRLYEGMLKEMRDAAGDSGEFYTPRPVVRLMVEVSDPRLGETVLDPAAGTGGFLVEAFSHLSKQVKTVKDKETLQRRSIFGTEPKPLPYLLCQMNLLLHGLEAPDIGKGNSLAVNIKQLTDKDRVDVIVTNPPFGGEEQASIKANFPEDKQTAETALLFLQLIMRRLRRQDSAHSNGGRAAVVVPNGTLFGDGVCARIKEELLTQFNLHTIVRLPNGVFAPYTSIPTNLLFFDRSGPTKNIWFYEQPMLEGRKNYTKTAPIQYEEFAPLLAWWKDRRECPQAWRVKAADVLKYEGESADKRLVSCNLDIKNPNAAPDLEHLPPGQLVEDILTKERRIIEIMEEIKGLLAAPVEGATANGTAAGTRGGRR
ncbi:MAG: N-6 DNA methylase [Phycisphaerales bacterium]